MTLPGCKEREKGQVRCQAKGQSQDHGSQKRDSAPWYVCEAGRAACGGNSVLMLRWCASLEGVRFGDYYERRAWSKELWSFPRTGLFELFVVIGWTPSGKTILMQPVPWRVAESGSAPVVDGASVEGKITLVPDVEWQEHHHVAAPIHTENDYAPVMHPGILSAVQSVAHCADVASIILSYIPPPSAVGSRVVRAHHDLGGGLNHGTIGSRNLNYRNRGSDPAAITCTISAFGRY